MATGEAIDDALYEVEVVTIEQVHSFPEIGVPRTAKSSSCNVAAPLVIYAPQNHIPQVSVEFQIDPSSCGPLILPPAIIEGSTRGG
jgi:hypothetical protein